MFITDRVYGPVELTEQVILELIGSSPVQRLRRINQSGASQYVLSGKTVTRYEHSLGVMILLRMLGAPLEEQIAGLLHDVPHTAFSHVIDFVFTNDNHEYHERFRSDIVLNSEIPDILSRHNIAIDRILDDTQNTLLERELPDLCADRIDYTLRDMTARFGYGDTIDAYVNNLDVRNNEIVFKGSGIARQFAEDYLRMDRACWSHPLEITLFHLLAEAIKIALDEEVLSHDDLFRDDDHVLSKLQDAHHSEIVSLLAKINPSLTIMDDPDDFDFFVRTKLRYVNPKFRYGNKGIRRVTDVYADFTPILDDHRARITQGNYIRILTC